jgi:hypothetical protein
VWHDVGSTTASLVDALGQAGLPKSFWDVPRSGAFEGIWGILRWAETATASEASGGSSTGSSTGSSGGSSGSSSGGSSTGHFDLVGCPDPAQLPAAGSDVEYLPKVHPPKSPPQYLWLFWDTVPDPPSDALPPVVDVAYHELALGKPVIHLSPSSVGGIPQSTVVNVNTWLWIDPLLWHVAVVSATAGPYTATVWAEPVAVAWSAHWDFPSPADDPERATSLSPFALALRCAGPGVAYRPELAATAQSSSCTADFSQPTFGTWQGLTATVDWSVHWALSDSSTGVVGGEGLLPDAATSATEPLRVLQVESVISRG